MTLRTGGAWAVDGTNPEPYTKIAGAILLTAYSAYVIGDEAITYYNNKKKEEEWRQRITMSKGKGERNQTGKASGTNSPFKKLKPDPNKPGNVLEKNSHTGKTTSKPAPDGFFNWWNNK